MRRVPVYKVGLWQFDPTAATLRQGSLERSLEHRTARVLDMLCRRRGEVVSKAELLTEVWEGRQVSPNSVAIVIGDLRRSLGDNMSEPSHIVTVGKLGYRLTPAPEIAVPAMPHGRRRASLAVGTGLILAGAVALMVVAHGPAPIDVIVVPTRNDTGQPEYDGLARSLTAVLTDRMVHFQGVRVLLPDGAAPPRAGRFLLKSRLILWNAAPELAIIATDTTRHSVIWSAFAAGDAGSLARSAATRLDALQARLAHTAM